MARQRKRTCDVTGITTSERNFYAKQSHLKPVDNLSESLKYVLRFDLIFSKSKADDLIVVAIILTS